jgi:hypothetical protein
MVQSMNIQSLASTFTLKDGELTSAGVDYVTALSPPAQAWAA